jgi:hypothetical protein
MFLYCYIVLVNSWYCVSEFYPELTWFFVIFHPVSITVNIEYIASPANVTLLAVEQKMVGIRHNLLCVK